MTMHSCKFILLICFLLNLESCVSDEQIGDIEFVTESNGSEESQVDDLSDLAKLEKVAPRGSKKSDHVMDIYALLDGIEAQSQDKSDEALNHFRKASEIASGRFSSEGFYLWLQLYFSQIGKKMDSKVAAKLVWAETGSGKKIDHFKRKKIDSVKDLEKELIKRVDKEFISEDKKNNGEVLYPSEDFGKQDPFLKKHSRAFCKASGDPSVWAKWTEKLSEGWKVFWQARVDHCLGKFRAAAVGYQAFIDQNKATADTVDGNAALESAYQLTAIYRWIDEREKLAAAYRSLLEIWRHSKVSRAPFADSAFEFKLRQINDRMWVGRYQALVGDFEYATQAVQEGLKMAEQLDLGGEAKTNKQREKVKELRAEGHHVLAFRIFLEKQKYESALSQTLLGLDIKGIDSDWKNRFEWYRAFYSFLAGRYDEARKLFEDYLGEIEEDKSRDRVYFWLAESYRKLGRVDEANFYSNALKKEYPLSYYSIVPDSLNNSVNLQESLKSTFGEKAKLLALVREKKEFSLPNLQSDSDLKRLLIRAQILTKAKIRKWATIAVSELHRESRRANLTLEEDIYISRLHFLVGNYYAAISLTTELSKRQSDFWKLYPEQILIYYPMAHMEQIQKHSLEFGLEPEDLLAIIRQESSFREGVRSPAGALGLMQLMPNTAEMLHSQAELTPEFDEKQLKEADKNVKYGSMLLRNLSGKYQGRRAPIYGAYNAGEFVVDIWLQRRHQDSVLLWAEGIPFGETANYVKNVWRNYEVYRFLRYRPAQYAQFIDSLIPPSL